MISKPAQGVVVGLVFLIAIGLVGRMLQDLFSPAVASVDTVYTFVDREARARAETTRVTVTRFRDRIDSIIKTDTLNQRDTVFLRSIDTLLIECNKCAGQIDSLRKVIKNLRDTIAQRDRALAQCKKSRPWYAAGGALAGALVCR